MLLGDADELGDDRARQRSGEVVHEVALARGREAFDEVTRDLADAPFEVDDPLGGERARHDRTQVGVARGVHVDHLRHQRVGLRHHR